jgi:4-aminobutyrate aminotransferase/(S)-3-amino-2-methylpropionate transaminase
MTDSQVPTSRKLLTSIPGPRSHEIQQRRKAAVSAGVSHGLPAYIEAAHGAILVDVDGNALLDLGSGIAVTSVGHSPSELVAAISEQAAKLIHSCFMVTPYEGYVEVAEALNALTPGQHEKRSALFNSGAEAVENAVKVARLATGRPAIAVFDHAYHGRTNLTMALTAKNMPYKDRFGPFAPEIYRAPMSYPFHDPEGMTGQEAAARAIEHLSTQVGAHNLAGLLIEPIQGEGGFIVPAPGFLASLADWCTQEGILLIADEIQSGFCRTGAWFASEHEKLIPDLITTAKGIAGGMPLAALTGRAEIMDAVHEGGLGGTYGGNPVATASALAAITMMRESDLCAKAKGIESQVRSQLEALVRQSPRIGELRGRGAMLALEFIDPQSGAADAQAAKAVVAACNAEGVIVLSCGTYGNVIRLLPPLVITEDQLTDGLKVLTQAIQDLT